MSTPLSNIAELANRQANAEIRVNEAFRLLEALSIGRISAGPTNSPPGSPVDGDVVIVGDTPTGDFVGNAGKIAYYSSGWIFLNLVAGMSFYHTTDKETYTFDGTDWLGPLVNLHALGHTDELTNTSAFLNMGSNGIDMSATVGLVAPYDLRIVTITGCWYNTGTSTYDFFINGTNVFTTASMSSPGVINTLSIDVTSGQTISVRSNTTGTVNDQANDLWIRRVLN